MDLNSIVGKTAKKVFLCSHTLEHIYDTKNFFHVLAESSNESDEFFFQFPSLEMLLKDSRFDQIHHQHINYFSLESFSILASEFGFEILAHRFDPDHYGALMTHFRKGKPNSKLFRYKSFPTVEEIKLKYGNFLRDMQVTNQILQGLKNDFYCYGSSLMLPILAYYLPNMAFCKAIIDDDPSKHGLCFVNFYRKIISGNEIDWVNQNVLVTAVSTKLATRKVLMKLFKIKTKNVILPLSGI